VTTSVDAMLRGEPFDVDVRSRGEDGEIQHDTQTMLVTSSAVTGRRESRSDGDVRAPRESRSVRNNRRGKESTTPTRATNGENGRVRLDMSAREEKQQSVKEAQTLDVFVYGVARNRLMQAAKQIKAQINIVDSLEDADVLLTLKSYYRKQRRLIKNAEQSRIPVYVLRANTVVQMEGFLAQALNMDTVETSLADPFDMAVAEADRAIQLIQAGEVSVDLRPVNSSVRRYQHQMARQADLVSHSYGKEPNRFVRIFSERRN
jgi:hypothetical protein